MRPRKGKVRYLAFGATASLLAMAAAIALRDPRRRAGRALSRRRPARIARDVRWHCLGRRPSCFPKGFRVRAARPIASTASPMRAPRISGRTSSPAGVRHEPAPRRRSRERQGVVSVCVAR